MARLDRRDRVALDEAYRYYRRLESGDQPELFTMAHTLSTVGTALAYAGEFEFKLTRQLWKRLHEALFEAYLTRFEGDFSITDSSGAPVEPPHPWPEQGLLGFRPAGCKRTEDTACMDLGRIYPQTYSVLHKLWTERRTYVRPDDFNGNACEAGVCHMKPVVLGHDVLCKESSYGKEQAYQRWWDLYWQAYCTSNKEQRSTLYQSMMALEAVWGDLYY